VKRFAIAAVILGCGSSESSSPTTDVDSAIATDTATTVDDTGTVTTDTTTPPDDTATTTTDVATDTPVDMGGVMFGPYPAGPYGNKVGDTFQNLTWEGYVNVLADAISNTKPYVASVDFDKLRKDAVKGYALVHVSEFF
jgi:hypothetical protein